MRRELKTFKSYALKKGAVELYDLYSEEGFGLTPDRIFYFEYPDIEDFIKSFEKDKKRDIIRNTKYLPGTKFRVWVGSGGYLTIASLKADDAFTGWLRNQKPSGISTFMPSGRNSL